MATVTQANGPQPTNQTKQPPTTPASVSRPPAPASRPARLALMGPPAIRLRSGATTRRAPRPNGQQLGSAGQGEPLPEQVREPLEEGLQADLSQTRIHTDARARATAADLSARAFTYGNHIFLGPHEQPTDLRLMAHEATHVLQQQSAPAIQRLAAHGQHDAYEREADGAAERVLRGETFNVRERVSQARVQRLSLSDALDRFADYANAIPGYRMFTIVLGVNPINMSRVERSAANIMRAIVEFIPGGNLITRALDSYGVFDKVGAWVEGQIKSLGMTGAAIRDAVMDFLHSLSWTDIFDLGGVWERAKRIFTEPISRLINFAKGLITGILDFIRQAVLKPLAALAQNTAGYDLLKAVLGQDPVTGEPVPRNADTLIGGFMKLIGQQEVWNNLKRANAVARAWAWFQGALAGLLGFVRQIPGMIVGLIRSIGIEDFLPITNLFGKIVRTFGGFFGSFISWAGGTVLDLLKIIFDVVAPSVMPYIMKAAGAFKTIVRNPIGFVGNLVRAGIQGFRQFAGNFLNHLRRSLIEWLTGTLSGAGVYIPQAFSLMEIIKFVLSVLGLTWQNIRGKLVRVIGETAVRVLETGFDLVVTLVTQGPAAAWQKIVEGISNLRDMVMEQIMTFVRERVVQAAITRLLTSLNPAGAFIQAIIATYNTIMFFVERLQQIGRVVAAYIDSIAAIASGNIGTAANRVETTMAGMLTLVISFLARIAGLGRVSDAVVNIVNRVRAPVDRALDRVITWIVDMAKRAGKAIMGAIRGKDERTPEEKQRDLDRAVTELRPRVRELFRRGPPGRLLPLRLAIWKRQYKLTDLAIQPSGAIVATINPSSIVDQLVPPSNQAALAVIHATIVSYFATKPAGSMAADVLSTGTGKRDRPFDPRAAGLSVSQGLGAVLTAAPAAARGETAWVVGSHGPRPVVALLQRIPSAKAPGQGEVYIAPPSLSGTRAPVGPYQRSAEVPGISPAPPPTGRTAATNITDPFVRGGAPPSGSLAAGYQREMRTEGRVSSSISVAEAQAAGAATLLEAFEMSARNPFGSVSQSAMQERTIASGQAAGTTMGETQGGAQAAKGSSTDYRGLLHSISRYDPATGALRPPGSPDIVPDPKPRGVTSPVRYGSEQRIAGQMTQTIEAIEQTILNGMMTNGVVLLQSTADIDQIRNRTLEYLRQNHPLPR